MLAQDAKSVGAAWRKRLSDDPLARRMMAMLSGEGGGQAPLVLQHARAQNPAIDAIITSDFDRTREHVVEHFQAFLLLPTDGIGRLGEDPMAFVRVHGVRRARAGVPLTAVLQGYRAGHKTFWLTLCAAIERYAASPEEGLRTAMLLSDYCIDYTNLISNVLTQSYLAEEAILAAQRTRLNIAAVDDLLHGQLPRDADALDLCAACGIADGRTMSVAVVRADRQESRPDSARRRGVLARALELAIPAEEFGRLINLRDNEIVLIVTSDSDTGSRLARALRNSLPDWKGSVDLEPRIGIGLDVRRISELPRAYAEAADAIELSSGDIQHLADVGVEAYLRHRADETALRLTPAWAAALIDAGLAQTLEAYAATSMNIKACAGRLDVHGNTVYHRLARVRRLTGIDPRTYPGLTQLLTAMAVVSAKSNEA